MCVCVCVCMCVCVLGSKGQWPMPSQASQSCALVAFQTTLHDQGLNKQDALLCSDAAVCQSTLKHLPHAQVPQGADSILKLLGDTEDAAYPLYRRGENGIYTLATTLFDLQVRSPVSCTQQLQRIDRVMCTATIKRERLTAIWQHCWIHGHHRHEHYHACMLEP